MFRQRPSLRLGWGKHGRLRAPANVILPAITGTTTEGETLSSSTGTWTNAPESYAYQWMRALTDGGEPLLDGDGRPLGVEISGATNSTYELTADDVGEFIFVDVTATNRSGSASISSDATTLVAAAGGAAAILLMMAA
jgi:hypothetical protein